MSQQECFDVLDHEMNRIGSAARWVVHQKGLWHQTFHCWIYQVVSGRLQLLFQHRHPSKDTFPNLLDISCAGHLAAGEQVEDGVRELEEELGLTVSFHDLEPCGIVQEEQVIEAGGMDREFCHVFVYRCNQPLSEYHVQLEEVSGLYWMDMMEIRSLIDRDARAVYGHGFSVHPATGERTNETRWFELKDFVPHHATYFERVFRKMEVEIARSSMINSLPTSEG